MLCNYSTEVYCRIIVIYFFSNVDFDNTTNLKYTVENEILTTFVRSIWHNFNCTILQSMHFSKINNVFTGFTIFISRLQMCRISLSSKTVNFFAKPCNLLKNNECWCQFLEGADLLFIQQSMEIQLEDDLAQRYAKYALISKVRYTLKQERTSRGTLIRIRKPFCVKEKCFQTYLEQIFRHFYCVQQLRCFVSRGKNALSKYNFPPFSI